MHARWSSQHLTCSTKPDRCRNVNKPTDDFCCVPPQHLTCGTKPDRCRNVRVAFFFFFFASSDVLEDNFARHLSRKAFGERTNLRVDVCDESFRAPTPKQFDGTILLPIEFQSHGAARAQAVGGDP